MIQRKMSSRPDYSPGPVDRKIAFRSSIILSLLCGEQTSQNPIL